MASGNDNNTICIWDLNCGEIVKTINGTSPSACLIYSIDGIHLYAGTHDFVINKYLTCDCSLVH